jgi:hypothetical protein
VIFLILHQAFYVWSYQKKKERKDNEIKGGEKLWIEKRICSKVF